VKERGEALRGLDALQAQLEEFRWRYLSEGDPETRKAAASGIRDVTAQILRHADSTPPIKISARLVFLYIEGAEAERGAQYEMLLSRMREAVGLMQPHERLAAERVAKWESDSYQVLKEAYELKHPILVGEALNAIVGAQMSQFLNARFHAIHQGKPPNIPPNVVSRVLGMLAQAKSIFEASGATEGMLHAKMLRADFLEVVGDAANAKEIGREVYPIASAMGYLRLAERAKDLLDDKTLLMEFERGWIASKDVDDDIWFSLLPEDDLLLFANSTLRAYALPENRLPVVREYCRSLREIAGERVNWCRHIEMLENLDQTGDPATAYTAAPDRRCSCQLHGYATTIITSDATSLILSFKQLYCARCRNRSPKR
jgi:hypothetical protein